LNSFVRTWRILSRKQNPMRLTCMKFSVPHSMC
jgi:hypothetical protein